MKSRRKEYASLAIVATVLIAAVLVVRAHARSIEHFIDHNPLLGIVFYILLSVFDAVLAPGATLPLIPVAARAWGRVPAALLTTAGWTAGALIAFLIARRWGFPLVRKLTSMERVRQMKRHIPEDLFWSIVLLRLVMPMDVISYVLGLFTDMGWAKYALATALGLTPSALVLAYLGRLPYAYDIMVFGVGAAVVVSYFLMTRRRKRR